MGSPPWRKRSMVEPFTVMMSSLPSLSQSISPAPPLIDSTMYFFSGVEMCETVNPASLATSLNCGSGGLGAGVCADATSERNRPKTRSSRMGEDFRDYSSEFAGQQRKAHILQPKLLEPVSAT